MNFGGGNLLSNIPEVVKNLLIINVLMLLATFVSAQSGYELSHLLGLHHWSSDLFKPHQLVTYLFLHGDLMHLFFNMFALFMFGKVLEQIWGPKRFLIYYITTGIGAGIVQLLITELRIQSLLTEIDPLFYNQILEEGLNIRLNGQNYIDPVAAELNNLINISTVGASGAVFGILLAFGMLFPNVKLMLMFPPIPLKAKYFVIIYGVLELYLGIANNPADNVAHFAHLGGMLFGFILIKMWKTTTNNYF